jgi:chromosome segregation ATPase
LETEKKLNYDKEELERMNDLRKSFEKEAYKNSSNSDFLNDVDRKLNCQLKDQVHDLLGKLEIVYTQNQQLEYRASRAENKVRGMQDIMEKKINELQQFEQLRRNMEADMVNLNEALSNAKTEIGRMRNELNNEMERSADYHRLYSEMLQDKEKNHPGLIYPNNDIGPYNPYQQLIQNFDQSNVYSFPTIPLDHPFISKLTEEFEDKLKINEIQQNKLNLEIADLKKKITTEESNKAKLNDIIKSKNEKLEILNYELKKYKEIFVDCGNEVKWNQDLVQQKDSQIKVLKENMKKKDLEIVNLTKSIEKEKLKAQGKYVEEVVEEKRKPVLFGPETYEDMN